MHLSDFLHAGVWPMYTPESDLTRAQWRIDVFFLNLMCVQTFPVHCLKSFNSNSLYPPSSPTLRISTSGQE